MSVRLHLVPVFVVACAPTYVQPQDPLTDEARASDNWADQDTHGVGTHRVIADALNVRTRDGEIVDLAPRDQQLLLTLSSVTNSVGTFLEVVFKGGDLAETSGWVAGEYLAYSELAVCADSVQLRQGSNLEQVVGTAGRGDRMFVTDGTVRNTGTHRYFQGSVNGRVVYVATDGLCAPGAGSGSPDDIASSILAFHDDGIAVLWDQTFGRFDGASPLDNIRDTAAGRPALTSCYGNAPCDEVSLDPALLDGMYGLVTDYGYRYFVTAIAGATHSSGSLHYAGRAFDLDEIDGVRVFGDSSAARDLMDACRALGATEVFGPSNDPAGHNDHIHCGW